MATSSAVIDLTEEDNFAIPLLFNHSKGSSSCIDLTLPDSPNRTGGIGRIIRKRKDRMGSLISRVQINLSAKCSSKYPTFDDELLQLRDTLTTLHNNIIISNSSLNKVTTSPRHKAKKKTCFQKNSTMRGVGFGGDEQDIALSKEVNNAAQRQVEMDKIVTKALRDIVTSLTSISLYWNLYERQRVSTTLTGSSNALRATLQIYLRNDSLVDVSARKECYEAIFSFCSFLANESFFPELLMDDLSSDDSGSSAGKGTSSGEIANNNGKNETDAEKSRNSNEPAENSCYRLICVLFEQTRIFSKLEKKDPIAPPSHGVEIIETDASIRNIHDISVLIQKTKEDIEKYLAERPSSSKPAEILVDKMDPPKKRAKASGSSSAVQQPIDETTRIETEYLQVMRQKRFDSVALLDACRAGTASHSLLASSYSSSSSSSSYSFSTPVPQRNTMIRIAKEMSSMNTSLPVELGSAIFVRCDEERSDVMKALIIGPEGTPYAHGCFEFDILLPSNYPNSPPKVLLVTTGGGTVRFNPNLYNCGKVCLSLLGTWAGPGWNPQTSTLLQVLVSIQSLIMVPDPYFNEPGYEQTRFSPAGIASSNQYTENIRRQTFNFAILQQLQRPSTIFRDVIRDNFRIKGPLIVRDLKPYISGANLSAFQTALQSLSSST